MNESQSRSFISMLFSFTILALTLFVVKEFIHPILWAGIIAIASWGLYEKWLKFFKGYHLLASLSMTTLVSLLIAVPCLYLSYVLMRDAHMATMFLLEINKHGVPAPHWLIEIPFFNEKLMAFWEATFEKPNGFNELFSLDFFVGLRSLSISAFKNISGLIWHRLFVFVFSMLTLFYFFKDGKKIITQIHHIGEKCLAVRWQRYVMHLPNALRATVNGILLVAIGVGILMGASYAYFNIPAPGLMGIITALFACVPFGAPIVFCLLAMYLVVNHTILSAICLLIWGTAVMFVADHLIRPALIGGAARLPFLTVLFGILGGISCFGILGLFLGPMAMVLFVTLWQEWTA